jgi:hypothetical protein
MAVGNEEAASLGHAHSAISGGKAMKFAPIIGCALMVATPAVAAPQWVEDLCWSKAARIAFMGRGDREHFIANCIADHTPPRTTKRNKRRY